MNKEQVENYITELESMFELSELEEHSRNILKVGIYINKLQQENKKYKEVIDKAIEYINKYAWQEDIIGGIYTTNGKPATDRYMKLEWDNCNELLDILKGSDSNE